MFKWLKQKMKRKFSEGEARLWMIANPHKAMFDCNGIEWFASCDHNRQWQFYRMLAFRDHWGGVPRVSDGMMCSPEKVTDISIFKKSEPFVATNQYSSHHKQMTDFVERVWGDQHGTDL